MTVDYYIACDTCKQRVFATQNSMDTATTDATAPFIRAHSGRGHDVRLCAEYGLDGLTADQMAEHYIDWDDKQPVQWREMASEASKIGAGVLNAEVIHPDEQCPTCRGRLFVPTLKGKLDDVMWWEIDRCSDCEDGRGPG